MTTKYTNKMSIIIPWTNTSPLRHECFKRMLNCIKAQDYLREFYEVIIVEQNTETPGLEEYKHIKLKHDGKFNKSWCVNVGAREAGHNLIVMIDADSEFNSEFFSIISLEHTALAKDVFLCWNVLIACRGKDNPLPRALKPDNIRTMGGAWMITRNKYFSTYGGMNESFDGYGGEDNEFYERLVATEAFSHVPDLPFTLIHQYHDWKTPEPANTKLFEIGRKHPTSINRRLVRAGMGKMSGPTKISTGDLQL
jgi:predicted glycosyltransferase involved in capsule biosynthesis